MSNRKSGTGAGCIVGSLFFMAFGFIFILEVPFSLIQFMSFCPVIFIFIIIIAAAGASSGKSKRCKPVQKNYDQDHYKQVPRVNPYIVRGLVTNNVQTLLVKDNI